MMEKIRNCISRERVRMIYKQKQTIRLSRTRDVTDKHDRGAVQFRARRRMQRPLHPWNSIQFRDDDARSPHFSLSPSPPFPFFAHTVCIGSVDFDARCCLRLINEKITSFFCSAIFMIFHISLSLSLCSHGNSFENSPSPLLDPFWCSHRAFLISCAFCATY